eukprot:GHVU01230855.1.p1 GENE.GHVU01230855.1~~GHVU01230855.1.p1  ORF type:complete len:104 (+),score=13.44 GHVU01230855.1:103-414(+)
MRPLADPSGHPSVGNADPCSLFFPPIWTFLAPLVFIVVFLLLLMPWRGSGSTAPGGSLRDDDKSTKTNAKGKWAVVAAAAHQQRSSSNAVADSSRSAVAVTVQ